MRARLVRTALRDLSLVQIRHVSAVPFRTPQPTVSRVYRELERDFGVLAPPIALHAPSPDVLAASWSMLRESLLAPGLVDRPAKEAVAVAVSESNACPYCVTMHSSMLDGLVRRSDATAVRAERREPAEDSSVRAIGAWARANATRSPVAGEQTPFPARDAPELVAVAVLLHYLNRMVNVFLGEVPLPPKAPRQALRAVTPILSWLQRSAGSDAASAGSTLDLLPPASIPADLTWTAGNPTLAQVFAQAAAAIDVAGERSVPVPVRELVLARLGSWDGRPQGMSRSWLETAISELPPGDRPAGRLALLTALASYQVDETVIDEFRSGAPADATLIELTSWASMAAAREAGAWMRISGPSAAPTSA